MAKALVLLQLTLLLAAACFTVSGNEPEGVAFSAQSPSPFHHSPIYPPSESPKYPNSHPPYPDPHRQKIQPPSQPPVYPPTQSPVQYPPSYPLPKRSLLAVQGVVFCKPCNYSGVDTLMGATPLVDASVKLECNNTKRPLVQEAKTDKNGYFYMMAPNSITTFGSHKCKVFLSSSPMATCNKPTDLHYGMQGAILMPQKLPQPPAQAPELSPLSARDDPAVLSPYELFTVGPFAFEPQTICPH
ncbi:non-classical arabinogalactan protein 31-like [Rhododendron vialii]|uniref:non-classical arabinogalactan protein 31-like n=1 Tax=Rhododendron vialii TaxID=182163 RepID=UPI00265E8C89|nr:non-classical arabinogalactan protein 31-like [Rhododendron vialii]